MNLILWRHAEAEAIRPGQQDEDRNLTVKGYRQADRIAQWLAPRLPEDALILASPAKRTRETVAALDRPIVITPELKIGEASDKVFELIGWPNNAKFVVLVGHQPMLGELAATLLGAAQQQPVRKGAIWWFARREKDDAQQTILRTVINPSDL